MSKDEAAIKFIAWAEKNGYVNIRVLFGGKHDRVWADTTEATGYPNTKTIRVGLHHHIEDVPPEDYTHILMSLEDRAAWRKKKEASP